MLHTWLMSSYTIAFPDENVQNPKQSYEDLEIVMGTIFGLVPRDYGSWYLTLAL